MPELPEVETVARQLDPLAGRQLIRGVEILDPLLGFSEEERLRGRRISRVRRIGKEVVFQLEDPKGKAAELLLAVHLRMTGRLIYQGETDGSDRGDKYLRAVLELEQGKVRFHDMRRFGTMKLYESEAEAQPAGAEPLDRGFNAASIGELIRGSSMEIKVWLLRQDRICGIGNIYASEILHDCGIDPFRPASSLNDAELGLLAASTKKILRKAIKHCGTTFSDFQNANGEVGGYQKYLRVYQHSGEGCRHCGTEILRAVQAQRSTFWCPACQR
ncbi:MAG: bifunctional DNA-formamidopyrimidine glycosylase/DNA-(apurinic or apyrimidinic site) lyase [Planctomycetales bacterium]|nr:bifunctional DNA-formamidopyrimidine glycosylase/DNA-(apurinic or apyrimidinic site) lyase [bacterium]UNM07287.1 MAG: bifunctional DNA-formamidopyrimidine glycosylase/DNA-(apurinic or apyrimidinic site) lyase [Planctomycetales bacterium]